MKTARIQFRPSNATSHSFLAQVLIGDQQSGVVRLDFAGQDLLADFPIAWPGTPGTYDVRVGLQETSGAQIWLHTAGQITVPITVPAAPVPGYPASGVQAGTSITFSWTAVPGATAYALTVQKADGTYLAHALNVGNVTSYTLAGFPNDGSGYTWGVAALNSAGWGAYSSSSFTNGAPLTSGLKESLTAAAGDNTSYPYSGMFFTARSSFVLTRVSIPLKIRSGASSPIPLSIRQNQQYQPMDSLVPGSSYHIVLLGTSLTTLQPAVLGAGYVWYDFDFVGLQLASGQQYLIQPGGSGYFWQSGYVPYPGGGAIYIDYSYPYNVSVSSYMFNFEVYGR